MLVLIAVSATSKPTFGDTITTFNIWLNPVYRDVQFNCQYPPKPYDRVLWVTCYMNGAPSFSRRYTAPANSYGFAGGVGNYLYYPNATLNGGGAVLYKEEF